MASRVVYDDFEPSTEVIQEKDCETIVFNLPDFKKEQLRVQLTTSNTLRVTGNNQISDTKYRRFVKEVPLSSNCNMQKISAKFENGKLYIRLPKLIVEEDKQPEPVLATPTPKPVVHDPSQTAHEAGQKPALGQDNATVANNSGIVSKPVPHDHDGTEKKTSIARDNDYDEKSEEEKKEKEDEGRTRRIAKYKETASNVATKLKTPRRVTNAVLVAIVIVSIGIYISKVINSCKIDVICT